MKPATMQVAVLAVCLLCTGTALGAQSLKPRIAVMKFRDYSAHYWINADEALPDALASKLLDTGKYEMVERDRIEELKDEQALWSDGYLDPTYAPRGGTIEGIEAMIVGTIGLFDVRDDRVGIGPLKVGVSTAEVEVQVRVVDATTGRIILADSARATSSAPSFELWGPRGHRLDIGSRDFAASSLGKATTKVVQSLAEKISTRLDAGVIRGVKAVKGYVILIKDGTVTIDLGSDAVKVGAKLSVMAPGEAIVHPVTGETIVGKPAKLGTLYVVETQQRMSKCRVLGQLNLSGVSPGSIVVVEE